MNKKILTAGVLLAGVMMTSGTALAVEKPKIPTDRPEPPKELREANGQRPPSPPKMEQSDSKRPPMPPDKKQPRVNRDGKPPVPPNSKDPRDSKDGRPPMPPKKQAGVAPR